MITTMKNTIQTKYHYSPAYTTEKGRKHVYHSTWMKKRQTKILRNPDDKKIKTKSIPFNSLTNVCTIIGEERDTFFTDYISFCESE